MLVRGLFKIYIFAIIIISSSIIIIIIIIIKHNEFFLNLYHLEISVCLSNLLFEAFRMLYYLYLIHYVISLEIPVHQTGACSITFNNSVFLDRLG